MNLFVVQNLKEILQWIQNYDDENCNLCLIKVSPSFPATPSSTSFMKSWLEAQPSLEKGMAGAHYDNSRLAKKPYLE